VINTEIRQGRYREYNAMNKTKRPTNAHKAYYAHVYFNGDTKTVVKNHVMFQLKNMAFRLNKNKVFNTHYVHRTAWNVFQYCYDFILKNESIFTE
jgi:hypothetical protein